MSRPWGLSRMKPFGTVDVDPAVTLRMDPASQVVQRLGVDGQVIEAGKHGTNTGTETKMQTQKTDGAGPSSVDQQSDQRPDRD